MTSKEKFFLSIETIFYVLIILMDVFMNTMFMDSMRIKYIGIALCFFYVVALLPDNKKKEDAALVRIAMLFTLLADTFLLWTDREEIGVLCFIVVQMCYFYRLNREHPKSIWVNIVLSLAVCGAFYDALKPIPFLLFIGIFYFVSLCRNVWDSLMLSENRYFRWGLVLFLICDINVILYNSGRILPVPEGMGKIITVASVLIWIFYLPSQVLLALSVEKE